MSTYNRFAYIYDELMHDIDYYSWMEFVKNQFNILNKKPNSILELGCGTGNFTKALCDEGYDVTAFDLSEDMLAIAYDKLHTYKNIQLLKQDINEFKIGKEFDAIFSVCDTINYITDYSDLEKVFSNVYSHLSSEGIFVFDINSYYKLKEVIGCNTFVVDNENIFYVWENEFDEINNLCEFYITFFVENQGLFERFDEVHIERAYTNAEIENALKNANFKIIKTFDNYSKKPVNSISERITYFAIK